MKQACFYLCALTLIGLAPFAGAQTAVPSSATEADIRVEFQFASPSETTWDLRLRLSDPHGRKVRIGEIANLSESELTSGMFKRGEDGASLTIRSRHALTGGTVQFRVQAPRDSMLTVESIPNGRDGSPVIEARAISVSELQTPHVKSSRDGVPTSDEPSAATSDADLALSWSVKRVSEDVIRAKSPSGKRLFNAGESLDLSVYANGMLSHASSSLTLQYQLYRVSHDEVVATKSWPIQIDPLGNSAAVPVTELMPDDPGVYEVRLSIESEDETIWTRLRRRDETVARLAIPVMVMHRQVEGPPETPWRQVGAIRPTESNWSMGQWIVEPTARLIPGSSSIAPPVEAPSTTKHDGEPVSVLEPEQSFQAKLPVESPGHPHKVTLRIPANTTGKLLVRIGRNLDSVRTRFVMDPDSTADQLSAWREQTVVHYALEDDQIWLSNLESDKRVAFESVSVEAGPLRLESPSRQTPENLLGRTAMLRISGLDWARMLALDVPARSRRGECDPRTLSLHDLWVACERLADQVRARGFSGVVIPANQGSRAVYESRFYRATRDRFGDRRDHLPVMLRLLGQRGVAVRVELRPNMLLSQLEASIHENASRLVELTRAQGSPIAARGSVQWLAGRSRLERLQYSSLHPEVQSAVSGMIAELDQLCRTHENFEGVVVDCEGSSHLNPMSTDPVDLGAVMLFSRDVRSSSSLAEMRSWVQGKGRETFLTWMAMRDEASIARAAQAAPETLLFVPPDSTADSRQDRRTDAAGTELIGNDEGLSVETSTVAIQSYRFNNDGTLGVMTKAQPGSPSTGQPPAVLLRLDAPDSPHPVIRSQLLEHMTQLVSDLDPGLLVIEDQLIQHQSMDEISGLVTSFRGLPNLSMQKLLPIDSASRTVQLRWGSIGGHLYVAMVGTAPWTSDVDLEMTRPTAWQLVGDHDEDAKSLRPASGDLRTRVHVRPGQLIVIRTSSGSGTSIRSWTTRVSDGPAAIELIKEKVTLIVERIGILQDFRSSGQLTNGGFEQTGDVGLIGWMHAQHPPGCVQSDDEIFLTGKRSVAMTTKADAAARTWIVSETLDPPASGRMAISLACRAESAEVSSNHRLRVSIEATRFGDPVRFSRELQIPRNGQWSPREVVLEIDHIDDTDPDSLRLTIDSLSGGRIWIDDVQLHDDFPTEKERDELQSLAFLAVQGLQRGNLAPSGRLLQNPWARYLLTLGPKEQSKPVNEAVAEPPEQPGVAERIRSWLPRPLRF